MQPDLDLQIRFSVSFQQNFENRFESDESTSTYSGFFGFNLKLGFNVPFELLACTLTRPQGIVGQKTYCKNGGKTAGER